MKKYRCQICNCTYLINEYKEIELERDRQVKKEKGWICPVCGKNKSRHKTQTLAA